MKEFIISVLGMTCDSCVRSVEACILSLPGVLAVRVSLADCVARVSAKVKMTSAEAVAMAVSDIGFEASANLPPSQSADVTVAVRGMHCNSCTRGIEEKLHGTYGVHSVKVSLLAETAEVKFNPDAITTEQITSAIESVGDFNASVVEG